VGKDLKSSVVTLKSQARHANVLMLEELKQMDESIKIDHSKLVSFILIDYRENYFEKNKKRIATFHRDSKEQIRGKLTGLSLEQLEAVSKYIEKIQFKETI
jgi:hypothetical protein